MEKILSSEEKIRRAEEIYYRRNSSTPNEKQVLFNFEGKKKIGLFKKMIIQMCICTLIYFCMYILKDSTYEQSKEIMQNIKNILSYDMDTNKIYGDINAYIKGIKDNKQEVQQEETKEETLSISEENENEEEIKEDTSNVLIEDASSSNQMEEDAQYVKENFSFIIPLKGTVTSRFGIRHPTTKTVPIYHTGIDIAANEGTVINAAMEGTVELVSQVGDYRKSSKDYEWRCDYIICTL